MKYKSLQLTFAKFVIPTIFAMLISGAYQIIDGIFVGNFIGADGLAAVNLGWSFAVVYLGYGLMLGIGVGSLFSIANGEKNLEKAANILGQTLILLMVPSVTIGLLFYSFTPNLVDWVGSNAESRRMANDLLRIFSLGAPIMVGSMALPFIVRNLSNPLRATMFMAIGAILNTFFSYLFIVKFNWEVKGAAIANLLGETIAIYFAARFILSQRSPIKLEWRHCMPQWDLIKPILINGSSGFFMYIYIGAIMLLHQKILLQYSDTNALTVYTILGYLLTVYYLIVEGVANGSQPLISDLYGREKGKSLALIVRMTLFFGVGSGVLITILLQIFPQFFIHFFLNEEEAIVLMDFSINAVRWHLFALFLEGFVVVATLFFEALGEGYKALIVTLSNMLLQIPLLFILPNFFGLTGIWLAMPLTSLIILLPTVFLMYNRYQEVKLLTPSPAG